MSDLDSGKFLFPFVDLYHYKDDLLAYKNNFEGAKANHSEEENTECDRHIDVLLKYLYEQPTVALARIEADWTKTVPVTTFDALWLLYKPGSDVFVRERGQLNAYVVESVEGIQRDVSSRIRPLEVELWNIDFNGKTLGRAKKTINVSVFDGHKEIHLLPAFPVRFHRDQENETPLREKLIERGRNFVKFVRQPAHLEYTGPSTFHRLRFNQARVIVDHTSRPWETELKGEFNRHIPRVNEDDALGKNTRIPECPCTNCVLRKSDAETRSRRLTYDEYDFIPLEQSQDLTDHQYLLCFSHVYAYALIDRLWDLVEVSGLKSPKMDKGVINTLVMRPESNKSMVKAICETYSEKEERESLFFADYIRGKGEGQIILLHGPPGTGKTLTAESVAEYTQRPLLSITASDLGHDPEKLERNLLHFFRNANKWDAIVLLDEADVYLERRSAHDLRRNSIVSVFLRALDYFQGILFLTTNRVGSFDEAFISRIHVQIGYEPLDDSSREQIWMNHFKKLDAHHRHGGRRIEYSLRAKEFAQTSQKLKDLKWNGREIRNAFQTGVTLACYEARQNGEKVPTLTEDHLSQVVAMSTNFKEYMKATLQSDESGLARLYSLRNDESKTSGDTTTTMTTKW
ncbi:P-loop containing nucleoside triphosphate hydrolase protein [Polyplosphaeria fusca]|uniref:P-loop containing nucleoside triphosphate hydrolase protein n=1 Tax=Polyplosphaeria fusca TaxID=682080 RepID=A0A9P4UYS5_9PLEO|nr:P-loop containing nucleoside triphosphate hydrolase protein [Polyplosphaeria fusca]